MEKVSIKCGEMMEKSVKVEEKWLKGWKMGEKVREKCEIQF